MLARRCGGASGWVTAMTIATSAPTAPEVNHLCPSITHSSPSRSARVARLVGSEPARSGSVIEKQERISPSSRGVSQRTPYSQLVSPTPSWSPARNRFHRPSALARSRRSTRTRG